MGKKKSGIQLARANLVGVIHTPRGFAAAHKVAMDLAEVRVDALPRPATLQQIADVPHPVILTIRRFDEGGMRPVTDAARLALYRELLPAAAALDIETRSLRALASVANAAHVARKPLILSFHDFQTTPSMARLRTLVTRARDCGASVVKIATKTSTPAEVARLLTLLDESHTPLAVMGMGSLGRTSRLLFAAAGSVLNYGWLDQPLVSGQWSAQEFRQNLDRLTS